VDVGCALFPAERKRGREKVALGDATNAATGGTRRRT